MDLPTQPLVACMPRTGNIGLPDSARRMLERHICDLQEAAVFLGIKRAKAYDMAKAYRERTGPIITGRRPYNVRLLLPSMVDGSWVEIPNSKQGAIVVRTDLLVPMIFPEAGWPF